MRICNKTKRTNFNLRGDLLYGGRQGKIKPLLNNECINNILKNQGEHPDTTIAIEGLNPPQLGVTGDAVRGENKTLLRKENKHLCRHILKAAQPDASQWTIHHGLGLENPTQARSTPPTQEHRNSMCPTGRAHNHPVRIQASSSNSGFHLWF